MCLYFTYQYLKKITFSLWVEIEGYLNRLGKMFKYWRCCHKITNTTTIVFWANTKLLFTLGNEQSRFLKTSNNFACFTRLNIYHCAIFHFFISTPSLINLWKIIFCLILGRENILTFIFQMFSILFVIAMIV